MRLYAAYLEKTSIIRNETKSCIEVGNSSRKQMKLQQAEKKTIQKEQEGIPHCIQMPKNKGQSINSKPIQTSKGKPRKYIHIYQMCSKLLSKSIKNASEGVLGTQEHPRMRLTVSRT